MTRFPFVKLPRLRWKITANRVLVANSGPEAVTIFAGKRNEIKLAITDTSYAVHGRTRDEHCIEEN